MLYNYTRGRFLENRRESDKVRKEYIFDSPLLLEQDKKFGGLKPRRTFIGPRCNGGLSDHLPVVFVISQE